MSRPLFDRVAWVATSIYDAFHELLYPLLSSNVHTKLSFQPQALSLLDISFIITLFLIRSLFHAIGSVFTEVEKDATSKPPNITLSMPLKLSKNNLDRFAQALGHDNARGIDLSGPQLLLFLSSVTEPAMLLLLAKRACPIRPLGAVNVRNRFELLRVDGDAASLLQARNGLVTASLHGLPRAVKRGVEYDLEAVLSLPDPESGGQVPVFRQVFTMLQFMKVDGSAIKTSNKEAAGMPSAAATMPLDMGFNEPLAWAAICKDYNPIHISSMAARIYGFRGKIAHGNHVVAKALDAITSGSSGSARTLLATNMPIWMEVNFRRPMTVPARFELQVTQGQGGEDAEFQVLQSSKVCIEGVMGEL